MSAPDPIDVECGQRIRARRKVQGLSQTQLAQHLGLSFQQVQKYERGKNRVSASMLSRACALLNTTPNALVPHEAPDDGAEPRDATNGLAALNGGLELAEIYAALPADLRKAVLGTARALALAPEPSRGELHVTRCTVGGGRPVELRPDFPQDPGA